MNVYLDESGDIGWKFDSPFRAGGSSRYLTIAFLLTPSNLKHYPKRLMKALYKEVGQNPKSELKATDLDHSQRLTFARKASAMVQQHPTISLLAITVNKQNVRPYIRADSNKLYNFMIKLCLLDQIDTEPAVEFIPDPRSIKVRSGNSLVDYLQTTLWFEMNSTTIIRSHVVESHQSLNIQFADILAHIVWRNYEDGDASGFSILAPDMGCAKTLFF